MRTRLPQIGVIGLAVGMLAGMVRAATPTAPAESVIQRCTATDQPLRLEGTSGEEARWLQAFDVPAARFEYTVQLVDAGAGEDRGGDVRVYRVKFPSPFHSPFAENNTVPGELYLPPGRVSGKVPAAIVLDIMYGNAVVPRGLARGLASEGVAALYMPMAYYNARRPPNHAHIRYLEADPVRALEPLRQTVMDVRRARAILADRPEIDPHRIGITGVSLGGIVSTLAAGVDGQFYRVCPILAGGDLATLVFHTRETRQQRQAFIAHGMDRDKVAQLLAPVEPTHFANRIDPGRCLMINARDDEVIPRQSTLDLWQAIGRPELLWLPSGHYSAGWYLPTIRRTAIDFLSGMTVKELEF